MKKTLRNIVLLVIIGVILVTLTACGNKLTATQTVTKDGTTTKETIEVEFKKDKAVNLKKTLEFEDEEIAMVYFQLMEMILPDGCVTKNDKEVIVKLSEEYLEGFEDVIDVRASKKDVKKQLEDEGYKVK